MRIPSFPFIFLLLILLLIQCQRKTPDYSTYEEKPEYLENLSPADEKYYDAYNQVMAFWEVPYDNLFVPTSFGTAHVIVAGKKNAPPVVLLHGMNASSAMWYPNIEALAKSFRVYAVDLLTEPGKSNQEKEMENTEAIIQWYMEIFDTLQLKQVKLVGASRGGWFAMKLALEHPEKVKKMVLLSPAQTFIWIQPGTVLFSNIIFEIAPNRERLENVLDKMSTHVNEIAPEFIELFYLATKRSALDDLLLEMQPFPDDTLQAINMPVMLLIGDEDIMNDERSIEIARENITNLEARIISDAGHFLSFDQVDRVNELMVSFLQK